MGYWDNQGAPATKVTWANPQIVPESARQSGGWYYNPDSGNVDRWWSGSQPSSGGSSGGGGGSSRVSQPADPIDMAKRLYEQARIFSEPAIQTLRERVPGITSTFDTATQTFKQGITNLEDRYSQLLQQVVNNQQASETEQTLATRNELGRRGITTDTGIGAQELSKALDPIRRFYGDQASNVTSGLEDAVQAARQLLANVGISREGALNTIASGISSLQGALTPAAVSGAIDLYNTDMARYMQDLRLAQDQAQFDVEQSIQDQLLPYQIDLAKAQAANEWRLAQGGGGSGSGDMLSDLLQLDESGNIQTSAESAILNEEFATTEESARQRYGIDIPNTYTGYGLDLNNFNVSGQDPWSWTGYDQ